MCTRAWRVLNRLAVCGSWFGMESRHGPPLGLDVNNISWYMSFLREHKFNAIRLLFSHEDVLNDVALDPPDTETYGIDASWESPELAHMHYIAAIKTITRVAADYGILIMLTCHRLHPGGEGGWLRL